MSIFTLKLIALIAMCIDHIAGVFGGEGWNILPINATWLRYIGRISFPIFAFCIANGWIYSHDRKKYFLRLCLCAVASQIPYSLAFYTPNHLTITNGSEKSFYFHLMSIFMGLALLCAITYWYFVLNKKYDASVWIIFSTCSLPAILLKVNYMWILSDCLNVLYTLILGMMVLFTIEKYKLKMRWWENIWLSVTCIFVFWAYGCNADYGVCLMGVILIVALYSTRKYQAIQALVIVLWGYLLYGIIINNWKSALATMIPAVLILLYNSKSGRTGKIFKHPFYGFYPIHQILIGLINMRFKLG